MNDAPFRPTLPRLATRIALAAAGSVLVHALFISGAMRGLADVFNWTRDAAPPPLTVTARLAATPSPPPRAAPA
ncbi:MAG: hypothetical protein JNM90_04855, partial [Burkholderiales bacterium]|nr:hypothetical protein [Burkholderiales bacterium]